MSTKIQHFLHCHLLWLLGVSQDDQLGCRGCCKRITGSIYVCFGCDFYLHRSCAKLPGEIRDLFHPCPLLLTILDYEYICNACFKTDSGLSNRCKRCEFDMHVEGTQRATIETEELIQHFTHWHPLKLLAPNNHLEVGCAIYNKLCFASAFDSFAYGCQDCNFFVHHSCMINIPRQIIHFFHPSCPLVLLTDVPCQYEGFDEASSGLAFHCGKCKFQLDVKCALLPTRVVELSRKYVIPFNPYTLSLYAMTYLTSVRFGRRASAVHVNWSPPALGWTKLNTDGASNVSGIWSSIGGVLRDSFPNWVASFCRSIGSGSVLNAEFSAVLDGFNVAWQRGLSKVV
ncbi:hypothetical protein Gorai_015161, partial [Gossypium raimondii]|nr:hypothetical protein [Gossypium raimondii]